jgi:hypothetical protein
MSLIGAAIAGGLQGGGEAAKASLGSMQDAVQKEELTRLANELDEQKQMRIQANNQQFLSAQASEDRTFRAGESDKTRTHETGMQTNLFAQNSKENALNRTSEEKRTAATNATSRAVAGIHADSAYRVAAMNMAKPTVTQGADGGMFTISFVPNKSGGIDAVTAPLLGTDKKQIFGKSDLTDAQKAQAAAFQARGMEAQKALYKAKTDPAAMADPKKLDEIQADVDKSFMEYNKIYKIAPWTNTSFEPLDYANSIKSSANKPSPEQIQTTLDAKAKMFGTIEGQLWKNAVLQQLSPSAQAPATPGKPEPPKPAPLNPNAPPPPSLAPDKVKQIESGAARIQAADAQAKKDEAARAADRQKATAAEASARQTLKQESEFYSPDKIRGLNRADAKEFWRKYSTVLTPEQLDAYRNTTR